MTGIATVDTINENTAAAGVTVDGLLIKDAGIPEAAVTAHQAALSVTESQISDLGTYETADADIVKSDVAETITAAWTFGKVTFGAEIVETVGTVEAGTTPELDPADGTIQTWTLSGNSTPTEVLAAGESITLHILDGTAYTITWPTMEWIGGAAPTLDTTNETIVQLWKVGSTLYGALVGVSS